MPTFKGRGEAAILTNPQARTVTDKGLLQLTEGGGKGRLTNSIWAPYVITTSTTSGRVTLFTTAHLLEHGTAASPDPGPGQLATEDDKLAKLTARKAARTRGTDVTRRYPEAA